MAIINRGVGRALENDAAKEYGSVLTPELADSLWREQMQRGGIVSFRIASGSMLPTLAPGDNVRVKKFPPLSDPGLGDIVLFNMGGTWVVHRVVGKECGDGRLSYWQKGDAEYRATLTPATAVAGRVVAIEHGYRHIDLNTPLQKAINRSIGAILYVMDQILRFGGDVGNGKGENADQVSAWRIKASGCFRKTRVVVVGIGARLMRLGARRE